MIIDHGNSTVSVKLVFFGPAMSGKTTTIKWIFASLDQEENLASIENALGRTMFFDYGCIQYSLNDDWMMNVHVWAATGQDFYRSTRESVMVGTDGVIFVADGKRELIKENKESWIELMSIFQDLNKPIPALVCLNKIDLPNIVSQETLRRELNIPADIQIIPTDAKSGKNVLIALKNLLHRSLEIAIATQA